MVAGMLVIVALVGRFISLQTISGMRSDVVFGVSDDGFFWVVGMIVYTIV